MDSLTQAAQTGQCPCRRGRTRARGRAGAGAGPGQGQGQRQGALRPGLPPGQDLLAPGSAKAEGTESRRQPHPEPWGHRVTYFDKDTNELKIVPVGRVAGSRRPVPGRTWDGAAAAEPFN